MLFTEVHAVFRRAVITHTEYCGFIPRFYSTQVSPCLLPVCRLQGQVAVWTILGHYPYSENSQSRGKRVKRHHDALQSGPSRSRWIERKGQKLLKKRASPRTGFLDVVRYNERA